MSTSKHSYALAYARYGFRVFPCHEIEADRECSCGKLACPSAGKHPRIKDWQQLATTAEAQIAEWWRCWSNANIGVACGERSKLTVLDVDPRHGGDALLAELEAEHGELPLTPLVITGSGGSHYYFAFEPGLNNAVSFAPGLDIRTEGGLVVGVGSKTKDEYRWDIGPTVSDDPAAPLLPVCMPRWLVELIITHQTSKQSASGHFELPPKIKHGACNDTLYRLARSSQKRGQSFAATLAAVEIENGDRCEPPLASDEIQKIVTNAYEQPDRADFKAQEKPGDVSNVWIQAVAAPAFIAQADGQPDMLVRRLVAPGSLSLVAGTRGLGKTNVGLALAVRPATGGEFLGETLKTHRVLYLNRDNPTATIRKRLRAWGAERANNLFILGRDKAPPFAAKDKWQQFPLGTFDLVIVDSLSAFLESIDEKDGGASGEAVASVLDAAAKSQAAFLILANTKRSGKAFRGSGVVADRADIHFETRDATDLKLEARREHWSECLPDPSDEAWGERSKRRNARNDYRVAFVCSKFRDGDEPEPFIVEIRHDDEHGWSACEVTAEVEGEHERLKQAADAKRRDLVEKAVEALRAALPVPKNPDATEILKMAGLGRDAARKLIDERNGKDWIVAGRGTKKDPQMLQQPEIARRNATEENSNGHNGFEQPIPAGIGAQYPQESVSLDSTAPRTSESCYSCGPVQSVKPDENNGKQFEHELPAMGEAVDPELADATKLVNGAFPGARLVEVRKLH